MEEEPDLSPAEATKKAMTEITAPIIAITLVLLSVFVPVAFIPGISGTLFRQFAVTISVAMLISALNALTLSPALCAVFLRHRRPQARPDGLGVAAHRQCPRRLCGDRAPPGARLRSSASRRSLASAAGDLWLCPCERRPGFCRKRIRAPSSSRCSCRTAHRSPAPAKRSGASSALLRPMPQVQNVFAIVGFSIIDGVNEPNAAFIVPTLEAVRRPRRRGELGAGADRAGVRRGTADPHRDRHPVQPAADHRAVDHRRVRIRARRARRPGSRGDEQRHAGASRRRQPRPAADPRVLDLHRQQSVDLSRHRPREGAGAGSRHERRVRRPAGDVGRHLHQQLQSVRPRLAGQHRGRGGRSQRRLVAVADLHSQQIRHRRAVALDRRRSRRRRAAGHHPLQQLPRDPDPGQPVAGHLVRHRARGNGGGLGQDLALGLRL